MIHTIGIAGLKVINAPERVRTVLGSCVGVAIFDAAARIGGLAHIMLPDSHAGQGDRGKFADTAVDILLTDLVNAGARKTRLVAKLAGGASMFGPITDNGIGDRNVRAVRERLRHHNIRVHAEDVGGSKGRKMVLDPATGAVEVQIIGQEPKVI